MPPTEFRVEKALSNRTVCRKCEKKIGLDELKLVMNVASYPYPKKMSECAVCGRATLDFHIKDLQDKKEVLGRQLKETSSPLPDAHQ